MKKIFEWVAAIVIGLMFIWAYNYFAFGGAIQTGPKAGDSYINIESGIVTEIFARGRCSDIYERANKNFSLANDEVEILVLKSFEDDQMDCVAYPLSQDVFSNPPMVIVDIDYTKQFKQQFERNKG